MSRITRKQLVGMVAEYSALHRQSYRVWRGYRQEDGRRGWIMQQFGRSDEVFLGSNLPDALENVVARIDEYTGSIQPPRN